MLTIEHSDVEEDVLVGDLFQQLGFSSSAPATDESGDSYVSNKWGIEAMSLDGYFPIEGLRWTKPERQVRLFHGTTRIGVLEDCIPYLQCSPEHIVFRAGSNSGWVRVGDLALRDLIVGRHGTRRVVEVQQIDVVERLCDLQVSRVHSYFANGVLSHNSHFLTMLGANALRNGIDVLHYTMELSEAATGIRYDSNLCDIDSNLVIDNKDKVMESYKQNKLGRLMIKEFGANTATIYTIRAHMERLDIRGFRPGLLIIDYADIMKSTRAYESLRHELKLIYEELRAFAAEKKIPVWTASQSNREGSSSDVVDLTNMSEAYGKAMVADVVLSISRRSHEKSTGFGRLYVAKNRAGRDGLVYPIQIDTARSKFAVVGKVAGLEQAEKDDESEMKKALRDKWKQLKNEPMLQKPDDVPTQ
jgi:hypothetical protein